MMDQGIVGLTIGVILGLTAWFVGWLVDNKPVVSDLPSADLPSAVPYVDSDHVAPAPERTHVKRESEHDPGAP
jgi:hypothetical protein